MQLFRVSFRYNECFRTCRTWICFWRHWIFNRLPPFYKLYRDFLTPFPQVCGMKITGKVCTAIRNKNCCGYDQDMKFTQL